MSYVNWVLGYDTLAAENVPGVVGLLNWSSFAMPAAGVEEAKATNVSASVPVMSLGGSVVQIHAMSLLIVPS